MNSFHNGTDGFIAPQGKKTSKANKMRGIWDIVVTNAENLWK